MKKTKIVCTIGPASSSEKVLKELVKSGMNVARLNMSHGSEAEHAEVVEKIKSVRKSLNAPIGIMIDLKGPEIRIGKFVGGSALLKRGQSFTLTTKSVLGDSSRVYVSSKKLAESVAPKQKLLLSDGEIELAVKEVNGTDILCKVKEGGVLSNNKSISVPGLYIPMKYLSEVDKKDILFGISQKMDFLAISFVQSARDVKDVRDFLVKNGGQSVKIISKIESAKGVKNMEEIIKASDGVMVARGDLGVEVDFYKLPHIQKQMLRLAKAHKKFAITATQMLESMIKNSRPTRAEVTDIANAVLDGSGAVMLSGETAMGVNPARCVLTMSKIVSECEKHIDYIKDFKEVDIRESQLNQSVAKACVSSAFSLNAKAVLVVTKSGKTAQMVSCLRPQAKVLVCTPSVSTYYQMSVLFGVTPFITQEEESTEKMLKDAQSICKASGQIKCGDLVVQTLGLNKKESDTLKIELIK